MREAEQEVQPPTCKVIAAAVIHNPYAGQYVHDLRPLYVLGAEVSRVLVERALGALGRPPAAVSSYGKGAIVGTAGEKLEHLGCAASSKLRRSRARRIGRWQSYYSRNKKSGWSWCANYDPLD